MNSYAGWVIKWGNNKVHVAGAGACRSTSPEARKGTDHSGGVRLTPSVLLNLITSSAVDQTWLWSVNMQIFWSPAQEIVSTPQCDQSAPGLYSRRPVATRSQGGVSRCAARQAEPCRSGQQPHTLLGHEEVRHTICQPFNEFIHKSVWTPNVTYLHNLSSNIPNIIIGWLLLLTQSHQMTVTKNSVDYKSCLSCNEILFDSNSSSVLQLPLYTATVPAGVHTGKVAWLSDGAAAPGGGGPLVQTGRCSQGSQVWQRAAGVWLRSDIYSASKARIQDLIMSAVCVNFLFLIVFFFFSFFMQMAALV